MTWAQGWFWSAFSAWLVSADGLIVRNALFARRMRRMGRRLRAGFERFSDSLLDTTTAIERFRLRLDDLPRPR